VGIHFIRFCGDGQSVKQNRSEIKNICTDPKNTFTLKEIPKYILAKINNYSIKINNNILFIEQIKLSHTVYTIQQNESLESILETSWTKQQ